VEKLLKTIKNLKKTAKNHKELQKTISNACNAYDVCNAYMHCICVIRGGMNMARLMELGLILRGDEAKEFLKNEKSSAFTSEQIAFFREAKRIYRSHRSKF